MSWHDGRREVQRSLPKRVNRTKETNTAAGRHFDWQIKQLKRGPRVKIGITESKFEDPKKESESGYSLGEIAVVNEFGTARKRADGSPWVPERSFIRSTHDEKRTLMIAFINRLRHEVLTGLMTTRRALGKVGVLMKGYIQDKIITLKDPPNKQSTVEKKTRAGREGDNPLIDTGQLLRSIEFEIHGSGKK